MKINLILFLLFTQLGFCQFGFVRTNYNNCSFFRELMPKEIKNNIVIQKKNDGLDIVIKIPIENKSKDFIQITLTTLDTIIHKYTVGADANDWFEIGVNNRTGSILVDFKTKCGKKSLNTDTNSSGFIKIESNFEYEASFTFNAYVNGVAITGQLCNIRMN